MNHITKSVWAVLCLLVMVSCHEKPEHEAQHEEEHHHHEACEHGHEHEAVLQLTAYSKHWEIYAEAEPFSTEKESEMRIHVTRVEDFKPVTEGALDVQLSMEGMRYRQHIKAPEEPGIYHLHIRPKKAGKAVLSFFFGNDTLEIKGLKVFEEAHEAAHEAEEHQIKSSNAAVFTKEQSWKSDFATELCEIGTFGQVIRTMGQVEPAQNEEQVIVATNSGLLCFASSEITEGRNVASGQELFLLDGSGIGNDNTALRYRQAENEYRLAKAEYERKQSLAESKIISESELLKAQAEFKNAENVYTDYSKNFRAGKTIVKSPINGHLRQIFVQNGQYVEVGQKIAVVCRNQHLMVRSEVQASYFRDLRNIETANFRPMNSKEVYRLEDLDGKILSYGQSVSKDNPLIPVIFQISNRADFLPGSFLETYIVTRSEQQAVTVPNTALIEEMGEFFVYVQLTPELFEKKEVITGSTDGKRTAILKGLSGKERIISKGALSVKLSQAAGAIDPHSGHHH